ncbi:MULTISPECIES: beta strand repeat-containing protein, partial [unclassified Allomuricauda]
MKKSILALLFLFSTGIAFSQTTVTLQDQCNCEVLKGTDVSGSGATTPAGADLGDIYVNTNTGTIYFWDGDTWELTASDDQQLTGFTFNDATNTLSLTLENGGSVNVDLSSLSDTLTDSNTTVTSFGIDGTNTNLVITDSDSNTFAVALADLAALIDTDTQLTDAQVATAVNNEFPNLDTDSTDDFSGDFGDLSNVPANLDTDSTDDFDGQWSSLTGVPADFADNVDNVDDADNDPANELQAITSTDGTVMVTPNGNDFDLSGFSGDFSDLTNLPANLDLDSTDDFDGQWSSLTGVPAGFADNIDNDTQLTDAQVATAVNNEFPNLDTDSTDDFSGDFGDLTNVPANLDLDSTDDFDGQWSSLTGVPADFADNVDNVDDADNDPANELQAITSTDGTVTVTPNGNDFDLSGFSGDFGDLSNIPANLDTDSTDDFSGDFGDLTNVPANLDLDSTDDFDGQWSSLTGVPAGFADNIDNDTQLTDAQVATAVNNEFPNLDTDRTDDFSGDFGDLTNVPANLDLDSTDDFDGQWSSLTGVPADFADNVDNVDDADNDPANELQAITSTDGTVTVTPNGNDFDLSGFSGDFGDLSNVPANLDTDSTDDFDGQWSSLTGIPADFADNVDNVDDADNDPANELQAITSTDGTVTVTPNGNDFDLSGFSGDFGDLSNVPANLDIDSTDDFSGNFGDLTNVPANLDTDSTDDFSGDFGDLTNVPANLDLDSTDDFDGQWSSLTGVPADFADNVDNVDDADSVVGNEYNTGSSITDGVLGITDGGGTEQVDLISNDANNNITFGSDGALYLNVASVSIAETVTNLTDNNNGTVTYVNENGVSQTINKSAITDNLDGTYTFDNGDGSPITFIGTDNDTQLTDAQVATAVNNEFPNLDTDRTDDFSGDFGDLTNVPANLDLDSTDDFDGQWSSLTGVPADFADNVDNVDDADNDPANELQAITSTDGTVTVTPNGNDFDLSGFSGDFGDLTNVPANLDTDSTDDFSGDFNDLTNVPANLDTDSTDDFSGDFNDLTNVPANLDLDSTDDFDGQWSSLTGVPADFADNVDNVDDADNDPVNELQAITSTDGTVTVTPNGNDFDLSGFSGDFGDLSNVPANLDTDSTDDFDG